MGPSRGFRIVLLLAAIAACAFPTAAGAIGTPVLKSSFGPDGSESTQFEVPGAIGVDEASHLVYVADYQAGTVRKFDEDGTPTNFSSLGENKISGFSFSLVKQGLNQIAVDQASHDFYVLESPAAVKGFHADGSAATSIGGFGKACGVAVDAAGNIYVAENLVAKVEVFEADGTPLTSFAATKPCNLAVEPDGDVYVNQYTFFGFAGRIERFLPSQFPPTIATTYSSAGIVDANVSYSLTFDSLSGHLLADEHTKVGLYDEAGTRLTEFGSLTASEGIAADGSTGKIYLSDTGGQRRVEIFGPPAPVAPSVGSTSFLAASASEADLSAQVNPNGFTTSYRFQYVTQAQFEASGFTGAAESSEGSLPPVSTTQSAAAHISGLAPGTRYRFRVVAESEGGSQGTPEPVPSFTTFPAPPPGLPDGRAYEMVSPPQKLGEVFPPNPDRFGSCLFECLPGGNSQLLPMQSDAKGSAVVFTGQPFSAGLASAPNEYRASRGAGGWATQSISPLLSKENTGNGYKAFSAELSRGVIFQEAPLGLSSDAPVDGKGHSFANLYLREEGGEPQPLLTEAPPNRPVGPGPSAFNITYGDANAGTASVAALSHVVFAADDALTAAVPGTAPAAPAVGASVCTLTVDQCDLYEWTGGELRLVGVLPGNTTAAAGAVLGSGRLLAEFQPLEGPSVDGAISDDGRLIYWSDLTSGQLYVRVEGEETRKIEDPGKFLLASAEGSRALLSDGCLYQLAAEGCEADLTQGHGAASFKGTLGAAEDLSRIYFVDTAALAAAPEAGSCTPGEGEAQKKEEGEGKVPAGHGCNVYLWEEGATSFVGTLLAVDNNVGGAAQQGDWRPWESGRTAQVSPDGRYLAFMSRARLSGYDSRRGDGKSCGVGPACSEVFEYEAESAKLSCASCNPSGARPLGESNLSLIAAPKTGFAPAPLPGNLATAGQGRLFFESQDTLSPHDANGKVIDVYEWEPAGIGSCARAGGCVYLISSGHAENDSLFFNSTPSGNDAFFITRQRLLPQDQDAKLDLYDARVGGGFSEAGSAACGGEACKGQIAGPPAQPVPGSNLFAGAGNPPRPKPCRAGYVKKQGKCVKKHKRKKPAKHRHRRANREFVL